MANLTFDNILTRVTQQLRLSTGNSGDMARVADLINEVYRDVLLFTDWWWAEKRQVINTVAKVDSSATVNVTLGSASVTFSSAIASTDLTGAVLLLTGNTNDAGAVYRVASQTSAGATAAILDAAITNQTTSNASFRLYVDSYPLTSDTLKVLKVKRYGERLPVQLVGKEVISDLKIFSQTEGKPEFVAAFDTAPTGSPSTGTRQLQVHPYPDKAYRLEVFYKQALNTEMTTSGPSVPMMPDEYRHLLTYGALAQGYPIYLNDVERGTFYHGKYTEVLNKMVGAQREYGRDNPILAPSGAYRQGIRRRPSTAGTLGSWFDRLSEWP